MAKFVVAPHTAHYDAQKIYELGQRRNGDLVKKFFSKRMSKEFERTGKGGSVRNTGTTLAQKKSLYATMTRHISNAMMTDRERHIERLRN